MSPDSSTTNRPRSLEPANTDRPLLCMRELIHDLHMFEMLAAVKMRSGL